MAASQSVTQQATPLYNQTDSDYVVQNNGVVPIYISTVMDVSPTNYHGIIGQGGDFTVPAGSTMYVCCDAGATGVITYLDNGSTINSGSTFTQASNQPVFLYSMQLAWDAGVDAYTKSESNNNHDVSAYSSIIISIQNQAQLDGLPAIETNYFGMDVAFFDTPTNLQSTAAREYNPEWLLVNANNYALRQSLQVPVTHRYFRNFIYLFKQATAGLSGTLIVSMYGSNEVITTPKYISQGENMAGSIPVGGLYAKQQTNPANSNEYICSVNGPAIMVGNAVTGGGPISVSAANGGAKQFIQALQIPGTAGSSVVGNYIFPMRPINVQSIPASGATTDVTVTQGVP